MTILTLDSWLRQFGVTDEAANVGPVRLKASRVVASNRSGVDFSWSFFSVVHSLAAERYQRGGKPAPVTNELVAVGETSL